MVKGSNRQLVRNLWLSDIQFETLEKTGKSENTWSLSAATVTIKIPVPLTKNATNGQDGSIKSISFHNDIGGTFQNQTQEPILPFWFDSNSSRPWEKCFVIHVLPISPKIWWLRTAPTPNCEASAAKTHGKKESKCTKRVVFASLALTASKRFGQSRLKLNLTFFFSKSWKTALVWQVWWELRMVVNYTQERW